MPARSPLPESLRDTPFSVEDARELGVSAKRLRAHDLDAPFRSVRSRDVNWDDIDEVCRTYAVCLAPDQMFSHVTAARLHRMPLPYRLERRRAIDIWAPEIQARAEGVIGHRSAPLARKYVRGLPVVSPARAWVQLGAILDHVSLVAAGDDLVRRKRPLSSLVELRSEIFASRGIRGIRRLRAAFADIREGTDSPMETRLRLLLVHSGLPEPIIGHSIHTAAGTFVGTPDLAYVREQIAIEYEGELHQSDPFVYAADIERRERMEAADWHVIRVIKSHLSRNPARLVDRVRRQLRERATLPSSVQ
jgi:hypothetical protein